MGWRVLRPDAASAWTPRDMATHPPWPWLASSASWPAPSWDEQGMRYTEPGPFQAACEEEGAGGARGPVRSRWCEAKSTAMGGS